MTSHELNPWSILGRSVLDWWKRIDCSTGICLFLVWFVGGSQQSLTPTQAVQQQVRLQRLQLEQDRLRQRQQEIIAMVGSKSHIFKHLMVT